MKRNVYIVLTFVNFSLRFRAQIGYVYLIKFTQTRFDCYPASGWVWTKRIWLCTAEVPMLMRQRFFIQGIRWKFWKIREFINVFPAKLRWMTIWQEWKKVTALSLEQKNCLENIKQKYVAFQPPRNLNKKSGIFMLFF